MSAGPRDAKRDVQVPLSPSVSALVGPPTADGLGRPASAPSSDEEVAPANDFTAPFSGCCARQKAPTSGSESSMTRSDVFQELLTVPLFAEIV